MKKQPEIDYENVPITKLPPGRAYGAGDLTKWSMNRAVGVSGAGDGRAISAVIVCKKCKGETQVIISKYDRRDRKGERCRHCGKVGLKTIKRGR